MNNQYNPDVVSHPGETLKDLLEERQIDPAELEAWSHKKGGYVPIRKIIDGEISISLGTAHRLAKLLGVNSGFWLARQHRYNQWFNGKHQQESK